MEVQNLNLARKWRSKNFDQIIGQDLPVKMLKNSLYLNHYFPVYLFSGQKGCGKTSTARVFAAAVNCNELPTFQKDPKNILLPCGICQSCVALLSGKHPDFIEIDAASNTGVDNVRQIIDSSALLPLMGRKKIYLIDEAHMLSKAAFNAFLKLMEEPPASVIFILATTDTQKIIETVRSRCFQLFFRPVQETLLIDHLKNVCTRENISTDDDGLAQIVKETGGSIRDALNLLEQVRFSDARVTKSAVYEVLGHLDDTRLMHLFEIVLYKMPSDFLKFSQEHHLEQFSAEILWQKITELLRACIWIKNGVTPVQFAQYNAQLQFLVRGKSLQYITSLLELFYSNESLFRKTTAQYAFLEVILLRICQKNESNSNSSTPAMMATPAAALDSNELEAFEEDTQDEDDQEEDGQDAPISDDQESALWYQLTSKIELLHDPLLESIFKQGSLLSYDAQTGIIKAEFPKELTFFSDVIDATQHQWKPLFGELLGKAIILETHFTKQSTKTAPVVVVPKIETPPARVEPKVITENYQKKAYQAPSTYQRYPAKRVMQPLLNEARVDVSNKALWPQATILLACFPGTITQIRDVA